MKAVIHIGMPKSGTSTIQAFLQINRTALSDQGVLYDRFTPWSGSQYEFPVTALDAVGKLVPPAYERNELGLHTHADQRAYVQRFERHLETTLAQQGGHRVFVGSSEHIYPWLKTAEPICALDRFLTARFSDVRYLVYLRSQQELVLSSYSEAIRRGHTHSLDEHLRKSGTINHLKTLNWWVNAVGQDRLDVRILAADHLRDGDLLADFCDLAGIRLSGLQRPERENTALSVEEIKLRRLLNKVLPRQNKKGKMHVAYRTAMTLLLPVFSGQTRQRLTDAQQDEICALNAPHNERLRRRFFPERPDLF